jgi:SAM-dependent methyltransferase
MYETTVQETQGLLSPALRNIRLRRIAGQVEPGTTVLDLGCGAGYLAQFLPSGCTYIGIDRILPPHIDRFAGFLRLNLNAPGAVDVARGWLRVKPQYLTCAAVVEHLEAPFELIRSFVDLIESGGLLVGTTAHPRGKRLHTSLARIGLCSSDAANEHHSFLDYGRIQQLAEFSGGQLVEYHQFLMRLNQLFVVQY